MDYKKYLEWDVDTWSRALRFWDAHARETGFNDKHGLEIGGRNGGLSCYFAEQLHARIVCSDYGGPSDLAKEAIANINDSGKVTFAEVNALAIDFPDNHFDFVVFKSVLGSLADGQFDRQQQAIDEMHRVLKPGGTLFFAENMRASFLHQFARKHLVKWGARWRYVSREEMNTLLSNFISSDIRFTGFLAVFAPNRMPWLKRLVAKIDGLIASLTPNSWKYVAYGIARK